MICTSFLWDKKTSVMKDRNFVHQNASRFITITKNILSGTHKTGLEDEKKRSRCLFSGNGNHLTSQSNLDHTCVPLRCSLWDFCQDRHLERMTWVRPQREVLTRQVSDCKGVLKLESFKIFPIFRGRFHM